jgi:hypothetical protein
MWLSPIFGFFSALDFRACHPKLGVYIVLVIPLCLSVHVIPYTVPLQQTCHPTMCFYSFCVIPLLSQQWECHTASLLCLDSVQMSHILYVQVFFIPYLYYVLHRVNVIRYHGCISIADLSANAVSRCVVQGDQCYVPIETCCAMHARQSLYL